jgi:hypothetical protein
MSLKQLIIEGTDYTPKVNFDPVTGILELSGRSLPENALDFYNPIFDWIEEFRKKAPSQIEMNLFLEYINSISHKMVADLLKNMKEIHQEGKSVNVNWYYDEEYEEMMEDGKAILTEYGLNYTLHPQAE